MKFRKLYIDHGISKSDRPAQGTESRLQAACHAKPHGEARAPAPVRQWYEDGHTVAEAYTLFRAEITPEIKPVIEALMPDGKYKRNRMEELGVNA